MAKKGTIGPKLATPVCRFSHVHVFDTVKNMQGVDIREITMLFDKKETDMQWCKDAMRDLKKKHYPDEKVMSCIKDGDKPNGKGNTPEEGKGHWMVRAWTKEAPGIRNAANTSDIIDPTDFYSGCYGRATITQFIYDNIRGIGFSFFLNNLQKQKDGDRLAGSAGPAKNDFEPLESAADNAANFDNSSDLYDEGDDDDDDDFL